MDEANKFRGYDLWIEGGRPRMHVIHAWPDNAMKVVAKNQLKENRWQHVCGTYDGKASANQLKSMWMVRNRKKDSHTKLKKSTIWTDNQIGRRYKSAQLNDTKDDIRVYNEFFQPRNRFSHGSILPIY